MTPVVWLLIGLGIALRLDRYIFRGALWIDEASLGLDILTRSFVGLATPLPLAQTAPVLFLWAQKTVALIGGSGEAALRALPLAAGVLVLPLFWNVARRVLPVPAAVLALGMVALSPTLVRYSPELKPYSLDAFVAVAVLWLTVNVLERPAVTDPWKWLALGGMAAVFASTPAVFVLAGAGLALLVLAARSGGPAWPRTILVGIAWAGAAGLSYAFLQRPAVGPSTALGQYMTLAWEPRFLTTDPPGLGVRVWWSIQEAVFAPFLPWAARLPNVVAGTGLVLLLGLFALVRRHGLAGMALLGAPLAALWAAAALRLYPIEARVALFAMPILGLVLAAGVHWLVTRLPGKAGGAAFAVAAVAMLLLTASVSYRRMTVHVREDRDAGGLVRELLAKAPAAEPVYVYAGAVPVWLYYSTDWSAPDRDRLAWMMAVADVGGPAFNNSPSRGRAVVREGDDLVWQNGDRAELVGIPAGIWNDEAEVFGQAPDPGWAANEVRRMRAVAQPCVGLYFTHLLRPTIVEAIESALAESGARSIWAGQSFGARASRFCWT